MTSMKDIKRYLEVQQEVALTMAIQELKSEEPNMAMVEWHLKKSNILYQMVADIKTAQKTKA